MNYQATKEVRQEQVDDHRNPICPTHKVEMTMITYSWGEVDFICPKGHIE